MIGFATHIQSELLFENEKYTSLEKRCTFLVYNLFQKPMALDALVNKKSLHFHADFSL